MQWLIDIIIAMIGSVPGFVDRGDPSSFDFLTGDLTRDNAWHDLDLSGIVPANSTAVVLRCALVNTNVAASVILRKKGNVNDINAAECHVQVASVGIAYDKIVAIDSNRKIQYKINVAPWVWLSIVVAGWFGPES